MKIFIAVLLLFLLFMVGFSASQNSSWQPSPKKKDATRVLVVTGGHDHDADFYTVFADDNINAKVDPHPLAFSGDIRKRYDVVVLYDMPKDEDVSEKRKQNLKAFAESGKGIVALHHAVCSYPKWEWYAEMMGGRYLFDEFQGKKSSYLHDIEATITPLTDHPITRGMKPFKIIDETYKDVWVSSQVKPLLKSNHPTSNEIVGWISPYEKSRIVYIQLGHDRKANLNPNYQKLVRNAIQWAAGKLP